MGNNKTSAIVLACAAVVLLQACAKEAAEPQVTVAETELTAPEKPESAGMAGLQVDENSFRCLDDMTAVRHFFVDNLLGELDTTIAVAESTDGGNYPPGSVVQLVPGEAMVKHPPGYNAATRDWEFFELDVSAEGNSIRNRGFVDVVNRFGGNCLDCHIKAEEKYDLICELDHGCDPIPISREIIAGLQAADPRCTK